jgi:AraC-like DNA-binding protein
MAADKTYYELHLEKISASYKLAEYQYIQLRQSKAFMTKYLGDKIALSQLAVAACISKFHYIRLFQRVYGDQFTAFITPNCSISII